MKKSSRHGRRYPWKSWFSKSIFYLKQGVDYDIMPHSMAQMVRNRAAKNKPALTASIKIRPDGTIVCTTAPRKAHATS